MPDHPEANADRSIVRRRASRTCFSNDSASPTLPWLMASSATAYMVATVSTQDRFGL